MFQPSAAPNECLAMRMRIGQLPKQISKEDWLGLPALLFLAFYFPLNHQAGNLVNGKIRSSISEV